MKVKPKGKLLKVRSSFSLDPQAIALLDDFSRVMGLNRSRVLNDILLSAEPQIRVVINEFEAFLKKVDQTMPITEDQLDMFMGRLHRNLFNSYADEEG